MSPPGKRRHNELNAAPPPETPRRTGKPGEPNNRDVMHSGKSCRVRGKARSLSCPCGTTRLSLPLKGEGSLSGFCFLTEILRLRHPRFTPFFARAKERRQNPLTRNLRKKARSGDCAATGSRPPETPRRTGKPGAVTDRNVMHSGKSCRVRAKPALHYFFFSSTLLCFFLSKKEDVPLPIFSPLRRLHCPRPATA